MEFIYLVMAVLYLVAYILGRAQVEHKYREIPAPSYGLYSAVITTDCRIGIVQRIEVKQFIDPVWGVTGLTEYHLDMVNGESATVYESGIVRKVTKGEAAVYSSIAKQELVHHFDQINQKGRIA
jgi:hypothetical protein